jgi:sarcosine oxidase subunit gamma
MSLPRRLSPIHEQLARLKPRWTTLGDMPVVADFGDPTRERALVGTLGLSDLSALDRIVVKGPGAAEFLSSQGLWVPDQVFGHLPQADGALVVRTGGAEFFVEDGWIDNKVVENTGVGTTVGQLRRAIGAKVQGVYDVPRQDVSLVISGTAALALFSQTCGYDFSDSGYRFVMTQVAGVSCSILPRQLQAVRAWQLWADGTYGPYLWETLLAIVRELEGDAVGVGCFIGEPGS